MYTQYSANKIVDARWRGQVITFPATNYIGLIMATRGLSNTIRSAAVALNDTVLPATPNGRIYKVTTAGTTGASEPTWPITAGGTVVDGTATWTEQTTAMYGGAFTEATYGSYARQSLASSLVAMSGTQGAGTTLASTGTSGQTSNNAAITFPSPTTGTGSIFGWFASDALTAGNIWEYGADTTPLAISVGGSTPSFAISAFALIPAN